MSDDSDDSDNHRERAILADRDRAYLRGEKDLDDNYERTVRSIIRKRVRAGLEDMTILLDKYPEEEIQQLIHVRDDELIENAIGLLYRMERHRPSPYQDGFQVRIATGIKREARQRDRVADVDINIEERTADLDDLLAKPPDELDEDEIAYLLGHPEVDLSFTRRNDDED